MTTKSQLRSLLPVYVIYFVIGCIPATADESSSRYEIEILNAYERAQAAIEQQKETKGYQNSYFAVEPAAEEFTRGKGEDLALFLENRITPRSEGGLKMRSAREGLECSVEIMALAKLGREVDVSANFIRMWDSKNHFLRSTIAMNQSFLPPQQLRLFQRHLLDNEDSLLGCTWQLSLVGNKQDYEKLESMLNDPNYLIPGLSLELMRERVSLPEETQNEWMRLDLRFYQWSLTDTGSGGYVNPKSGAGDLGRIIASDKSMSPSREYLSAVGKSHEDLKRQHQLLVYALAFVERGDDQSIELLRHISEMQVPGLIEAIGNRDHDNGKLTLVLMLHPSGASNTKVLEQLAIIGDAKTAERLDTLSLDDAFSDSEREAIKKARIAILNRGSNLDENAQGKDG